MFRSRYWVLAVLFAFALTFSGVTAKRAAAQAGNGSGDTWSGHDERVATISALCSNSTALVSAITNKKVNIRAITISSDTAGVIAFQDGSGGTTIAQVYVAANTPITIYEGAFGPGVKTTKGNGLYLQLSSATITAFVRYRAE